jgi:type I restriction-modification system DNA methylase subunit
LKRVEGEHRPPGDEERRALERFGGFGAVALRLFPDPVSGQYKSPTWQALGDELRSLLTLEEYTSGRRSVFNAFYTSPTVVASMFQALARLGVPEDATVLEPGCGSGNFLRMAPEGVHFVGVELDTLSGRIARALYPGHDVRIENFRDTRLPEGSVDAVIGNPPFADLELEHRGVRFSLHDYFFAKALDAVRPGGVLALVTSHFTLDKQNAEVREYLGAQADFLGAVRLPSDAFAREGTRVVTDIVFLRRRPAGEPGSHADPRRSPSRGSRSRSTPTF